MREQAAKPAPRASRLAPRAFTLTELLVVITIIAILAGLVTAAAMVAMRRARQARIQMEIQQVSQAFEDFNAEYGVYPPNLMHEGSATPQIANQVYSDLKRTLKKMFPRHQEPEPLIQAIAGQLSSGPPNDLSNGLNAAEAVYFWLGGFSDDERFPISGPGGPSFINTAGDPTISRDEIIEDRNRRHEFVLTQLGPRDENGNLDVDAGGRFITYQVNMGNGMQTRQINFWQYKPGGSEQPLVYFDVSRYKPYEYDLHASSAPEAPEIHAIEKLREGVTTPSSAQDLAFVNQDKFQILHSGLDDDWGDFTALSLLEVGDYSTVITYPEGPFLGPLADTLTNFTTNTLEQAQE